MPQSHPRSQDVIQYLQSLKAAGVTEIPRADIEPFESWREVASEVQDASGHLPDESVRQALGRTTDATRTAATETTAAGQRDGESLPQSMVADRGTPKTEGLNLTTDGYSERVEPARLSHALEVLAEEVSQCVRCPDLAKLRSQTVFGVGNPQARVVFFGEAPGADEDRQGEPFVGKAGQLLNRILVASTFQREDVYILNTLKCRPPGNRNPNDWELGNCCQFWQRQLDLIQPEYIVCLGAIAVRTLLQVETSIARLRGSFHRYRGSKVLVTYHPAYLLRNESAKRLVWEDMKFLLKDMGISPPRPGDG